MSKRMTLEELWKLETHTDCYIDNNNAIEEFKLSENIPFDIDVFDLQDNDIVLVNEYDEEIDYIAIPFSKIEEVRKI